MKRFYAAALREMPIAIKTDDPKTQHYELPTSFFKLVLGNNLKYRYFFFFVHCFLKLDSFALKKNKKNFSIHFSV